MIRRNIIKLICHCSLQSQRVARESNVMREDAADSRDDSDELAGLIREGVEKANGEKLYMINSW